MFWALVMTITVGGVPTEYVIDQAPSAGRCAAMLERTQNKPLYRVPASVKPNGDIARVEFACERTRIAKR